VCAITSCAVRWTRKASRTASRPAPSMGRSGRSPPKSITSLEVVMPPSQRSAQTAKSCRIRSSVARTCRSSSCADDQRQEVVAERIIYGAFDQIKSKEAEGSAGSLQPGGEQRQADGGSQEPAASAAPTTRCPWKCARCAAPRLPCAGCASPRASARRSPWACAWPAN